MGHRAVAHRAGKDHRAEPTTRREFESGGHYSAAYRTRTLRSRRFEARARSASRAELRRFGFDDDRE